MDHLINIFIYLSLEDIMNCSLVNKQWLQTSRSDKLWGVKLLLEYDIKSINPYLEYQYCTHKKFLNTTGRMISFEDETFYFSQCECKPIFYDTNISYVSHHENFIIYNFPIYTNKITVKNNVSFLLFTDGHDRIYTDLENIYHHDIMSNTNIISKVDWEIDKKKIVQVLLHGNDNIITYLGNVKISNDIINPILILMSDGSVHVAMINKGIVKHNAFTHIRRMKNKPNGDIILVTKEKVQVIIQKCYFEDNNWKFNIKYHNNDILEEITRKDHKFTIMKDGTIFCTKDNNTIKFNFKSTIFSYTGVFWVKDITTPLSFREVPKNKCDVM